MMSLFNQKKTIDRLNKMIDNAIDGKSIEQGFDESRLSALETKLSTFLSMNSSSKTQLAEEKAKINQLISDISHQTKTPLANILIYTQLLAESDCKHDELLIKHLTEQTEKLNFLISSLVKTSRLETGLIEVMPKKDTVSKVIDEVVAQSLPKAQAKDIELVYESCEIETIFDLKWTCEALFNIVDNAIKYTVNGGSVKISVVAYQMFCRIDVTDTGIGINEDEIAKIFSRFYRSQQVSDIEGVGIGLYLAREIITEQGGYIKVLSVPQKGSTFSVFLPM